MTQPLIAPDLDATPSIADQLRAGLGTLIRNWKVILGIILACLVIAGIVTALMPKTYSATSKAMVIAGGATSLANYEAAQSLAGSKAATYGAAVGSPEVAKLAQEDLGGIEVAGVSADVPPGTTEINVTGRASTPEDAVVVADTSTTTRAASSADTAPNVTAVRRPMPQRRGARAASRPATPDRPVTGRSPGRAACGRGRGRRASSAACSS